MLMEVGFMVTPYKVGYYYWCGSARRNAHAHHRAGSVLASRMPHVAVGHKKKRQASHAHGRLC